MSRFPAREFAEFNGLLASAVERGLKLEPAIELLAGQARPGPLRAALEGVTRALREGTPLPAALELHPEVFPPDYCALVRAGVAGGSLPEVLRISETYHSIRARLARKARRLALYLFMGLVLFELALLILGLIGRRVGDAYDAYDVMGIARQLGPWGGELSGIEVLGLRARDLVWIVMAGVAVFFGLAVLVFRLMQRWRPLAGLGYVAPVSGRLLRSRDLAFFCTTMSLRLRAGAALPESLRSAREVLRNRRTQAKVRALERRVAEGESLSSALFYESFFPRTLAWAVSLGESRGEVPRVFDTFAQLYASEMERDYDMVFQIMTPVGILALGNLALFATLFLTPFLAIMRLHRTLSR